MIGIIHKTLVECLHRAGGPELRRAVFREAGIREDRVFRMDTAYPDETFSRLFDATVKITGVSAAEIEALFASVFFDIVLEIFPEFISMCDNSLELLRHQVKIHSLIAAGQQNGDVMAREKRKFRFVGEGPYSARIYYSSQLQLCGLYCALARQAAAHYGDQIEVDCIECRNDGAKSCELLVTWFEIGGRPTGAVRSGITTTTTQSAIPGLAERHG